MAREAETLSSVKLPKDLPDGLELIRAERTLTGHPTKEGESNPKAVVSVVAPIEGNAAGVRNYIKLRSDLMDGDSQGVTDVSNAIRSAAFNVVPKLTLKNVEQSPTLWLPFSGPRVIDPFEAVTARIGAFQRDKGRMPTPEEYQALMAEMGA